MASINSIKYRRVNFKISYIIAILIPMVALGRCCFYSGETLLIITLCMLTFAILMTGFKIEIIDVLIMLSIVQMFLLKSNGYPYYLCMYCLVAALSFLYFKGKRTNGIFDVLLNTIAGFSVANMIVSVINFTAPDLYFKIADALLLPDFAKGSKYYYNAWNQICGLSDHYSRNAFFCVAGCLVFCAKFFSQKKKRNLLFALSELILLVYLGKRGHLLFMTASILMVYLLMEPRLSARLNRLLKLIVVLCIIFAIVTEFLPSSIIYFSDLFTHDAADISTGRFALWNQAFGMFKENPILGKGYGYFTANVKNTTLNVNFAGVHNDYLQWLCEEGIVGFIVNITIMLLAACKAISILKLSFRHRIILGIEDTTCLLWSILFQLFIIMYSMTGLPHYDYEVNIIYYIAMAVPYLIAERIGVHSKISLKVRGLIKRKG